jgi:hypothetical protein
MFNRHTHMTLLIMVALATAFFGFTIATIILANHCYHWVMMRVTQRSATLPVVCS